MNTPKEYVTTGALLKCSCGSLPSVLTSLTTTVKIAGQFACTTADDEPFISIAPFGLCSITQKPCIPAFLQWLEYKTDVEIQGSYPLLHTSWIACSSGGKIAIIRTGQK